MPEQPRLTALCAADDVTPGAPVRAEAHGMAFAVFRIGSQHYVTQDACTHGPGSLAEGYVDGDEVECPFHQGRFDIPTGRATAPPCTIPLRVWEAHIIDGKVCINAAQGTE